MLFFAGRAANWVVWVGFDATMVKLLGAALAALAVGSLLAARDPLRYRIMVQTEIVCTVLGALSLAWRLWFGAGTTPNFAYVGFGVLLECRRPFQPDVPVQETRAEGAAALPPRRVRTRLPRPNAGTAAEAGPPPASNRSR